MKKDSTTLCLIGIGFGLGPPKRHPSVTQGPPKRHAREAQGSIDGSAFVFNKRWKKAGWGLLSPKSHVIADIARDRRGKPLGHRRTRRTAKIATKALCPIYFAQVNFYLTLLSNSISVQSCCIFQDNSAPETLPLE